MYFKKTIDIEKLKRGEVTLEELHEICRQSIYYEPANDTQEGFNLAMQTIMQWISPNFSEPMTVTEFKEKLGLLKD